MRINFECTGGFANLKLSYQADTAALPRELADQITRLVEQSGALSLDPRVAMPEAPGPPDVFSYRLSLSKDGRMTTWTMTDVTAPEPMRPLLELLLSLALEQLRKSK